MADTEPATPQPSDAATGNPVFDFQADNRVRSSALQRRLLTFGVAGLLLGGALWLLAGPLNAPSWAAPVMLVAGVWLLLAGMAWGFFWRSRLREAFRRAHGPR